jgi:hypothetical protein
MTPLSNPPLQPTSGAQRPERFEKLFSAARG